MSLAIWSKLELTNFPKDQDGFYCGISSQADFILNYFLSKFLKFLQMFLNFLSFSISSQPGWQAGTIKATLPGTDLWYLRSPCGWKLLCLETLFELQKDKRKLRDILSPGKVDQVAYFIWRALAAASSCGFRSFLSSHAVGSLTKTKPFTWRIKQ